jgi:hypothetical protein
MYNDKTKIVGIDNIEIIINGTLDDMRKVTNPNQIGQIIDKNTKEVKSEITPMIMIINQGLPDYKDRLNILIENGGDMEKIVNYNGMSPREIAVNYRNY